MVDARFRTKPPKILQIQQLGTTIADVFDMSLVLLEPASWSSLPTAAEDRPQ
jgi:hypothetical protein